jgi:hypothetical protein
MGGCERKRLSQWKKCRVIERRQLPEVAREREPLASGHITAGSTVMGLYFMLMPFSIYWHGRDTCPAKVVI